MTSKDLLNILDKVNGFRASDIENATKLIKKLCKRDRPIRITTYLKGEREYFECPVCSNVRNINKITTKYEDVKIFCNDCGQKVEITRCSNPLALKEGMIATVICRNRSISTPCNLHMSDVEKIFKECDFFDIAMYDHYHVFSHGDAVDIIKIIPRRLTPANTSETLCLVRSTENSGLNKFDKTCIMNINELRPRY